MELKFYDVKSKRDFYTSNYDVKSKGRIKMAVAKSPYSTAKAYRIMPRTEDR